MIKLFKNSFLFSTIFLEILALIVVFVIYLSSSQNTLEFLANKATKDLNISYSKISGSLLDFIKIDDIEYQNLKIAKSAKISWSIKSFFKQKPVIKELNIEDLNISSIEKIANKFENKKDAKKSKNKKLDLPKLTVDKLHVKLLPYKNRYIDLKDLSLNINNIDLKNSDISAGDFSIDLRSNLAYLQTKGELKDHKLHLYTLNLNNIDIKNIQNLIKDLNQTKKTKNSFEPFDTILIDNLRASSLPYKFKKHRLNNLNLLSKKIEFQISQNLLNIATLSLNSDSDIAFLKANGHIKSNKIFLKTKPKFKKEYLKTIDSIFDLSKVNPIDIELEATQDKLLANLSLRSENIFKKSYEIDIKSLRSIVEYDIKNSSLKAKSRFRLFSKYAHEIYGTNYLNYKNRLEYRGDINISKLQHFPKYSLKLFKNAHIKYKANDKNLTADLKTDKLKLLYKMFDYKRAEFYLSSNELNVSNYFKLPKNLKSLQAKVDGAFMRLDFKNTKDIKIDTNISSNAIDLKGLMRFKNGISFIAKSTLSKNSILKKIDKKIKFKDILNSDLNIRYQNSILSVTNSNNLLKTNLEYDLNSTKTALNFKLNNNELNFDGDLDNLNLHTKIYSLKEFQKELQKIYDFNNTNLDGEIDLNATISKLNSFKANIKSRWLVYEYKKNHFAFAEKLRANLDGDKERLNIRDYQFDTFIYDENRHLFANKLSTILFKNSKIKLDKLWINDSIINTGEYDLKNSKAKFITKTDYFNYKGKRGDIKVALKLYTNIDKNKTSIKGGITILDALIKYKYRKTHELSDPDIIIIQEQKDKLEDEKNSNLILDISINSKKDIRYNQDGIDIKFKPDLKIWKESLKDLELLGRVEIIKGKYNIEDKEFEIQNGEILFGGDITNPYLSINAKYYSNPYDISINIAGTLAAPQLNFSSTPYLNQSDILSMLLFDSTSESIFNQKSSGTNSALRFLGNKFAKELVSKLGIKLDRVVILTDEKGGLGFEVGKKISKKATIIFINDIVQTIKVKYRHSDHFETDLTISPESSGIEFIYKNEQ